MEAVALKLPEFLEEDELVRLPASWEEYFDVLDEADRLAPTLTIQFLDNEIIMSQATDDHELIVGWLITLFNNALVDQPAYRVLGSNVKIVIPERVGDFNADLSVVRGASDYGLTPAGRVTKMRIKNPEIVVEVLSKSTRKFDLEEKLTTYKLIPSLQHILFVDQTKPFASVYTRTGRPDEWLNQDYRSLNGLVQIGDVQLPMQDIYRKIVFGA
jgi:Uma2 family endonuclease